MKNIKRISIIGQLLFWLGIIAALIFLIRSFVINDFTLIPFYASFIITAIFAIVLFPYLTATLEAHDDRIAALEKEIEELKQQNKKDEQ